MSAEDLRWGDLGTFKEEKEEIWCGWREGGGEC